MKVQTPFTIRRQGCQACLRPVAGFVGSGQIAHGSATPGLIAASTTGTRGEGDLALTGGPASADSMRQMQATFPPVSPEYVPGSHSVRLGPGGQNRRALSRARRRHPTVAIARQHQQNRCWRCLPCWHPVDPALRERILLLQTWRCGRSCLNGDAWPQPGTERPAGGR
jgi:hypothetical protein